MHEPTDEQKLAIFDRSKEILVSASAGSGKTTVMLERVFQLLQEGAQLSEMIICTFTNASCADIRKKLTEKLTRLLEQGNQTAQAALLQMPLADISTIDSLCAKICRNYFYYTDLDPMFEVLETSEASSLLALSMDEVFLRLGNDKGFEMLCEIFTRSNGDKNLKTITSKLYKFALSQPDPKAWLLSQRERVSGFGKAQHEACLKEIESWQMGAPFRAEALLSPSAECVKEHIYALIDLVSAVQEEYWRKKQKRAAFDFSDIAHAAYRILSHDTGGDEVRSAYKYLFVDEFQDINPLQAELFLRLSQNVYGEQTANRFYVGDVKQSIYRFRLSEPSIFIRRRDAVKEQARNNPDSAVRSLLLPHNFRSTKGILDFCDSVFCDSMTEGFGGIDYRSEAFRPMSKAAYPQAIVCGLVVPYTLSKEEEKQKKADKKAQKSLPLPVYSVQNHAAEEDEEMKASEAQANWVAEHIQNLVGTMFDEVKGDAIVPRKVEYGDIAVLLRSASNRFTTLLLTAFERAGIPYAYADEFSPKHCPVICVLLAFLRLIQNRRDDIQLAAVLKSVIGGNCSEDELAAIRTEYTSATKQRDAFWRACAWYCEQGSNDALRAKLSGLFCRLDAARIEAAVVDFASLASKVSADHLMFQYALGLKDGEVNAQLLGQFLDILPRGMTLDEGLKAIDSDAIEISTVAQAGAVTVTTVHKSKGLEYPFVILPNLEARYNTDDRTKSACILDNDRGISMLFYDTESFTVQKTSDWYCGLYAIQKKQIEEEMRILYVALTRGIYQTALFAAPTKNYRQKFGLEIACPLDFLYDKMTDDTKDGRFTRFAHQCLPPSKGVRDAVVTPSALAIDDYRRYTDFVYPHAPNPVKTTVTRLSHTRMDIEPTVVYNGLVVEQDAQGMRVGDAYHKFLERYDYGASFASNCSKFQKEYPAFGSLIQPKLCKSAIKHLERRIDGRTIYRELPFFYNADGVLVQGVVDLLIDADDGVEIVDYKTGKISDKLRDTYQKQIALYAEAVSNTLKKKVTRQSLYAISGEQFIDFV